MFKANFLSHEQAQALAHTYGTPLFVYSRDKLQDQAATILGLAAPYGLTVRYAMKANPHAGILEVFDKQGIAIDASSGYEAEQALQQGIAAKKILLTSQQLAHNLEKLVGQGVQFNATSLHQLEAYGKAFPGSSVSVRLNPGLGSGHSLKVTTGGPTSSFGIWHEYIPRVHELAKKYQLTIERLHTHIGSGADPAVWQQAAHASLDLAEKFPTVKILNLGGGFKVARMEGEQQADMGQVGSAIAKELEDFHARTGRKLHLELEPGTFLVANAGILIARVADIVDTGEAGYTFLKLDTGMNDILRPSLYGAQHPMTLLSQATEEAEYVVVGHNCESGDLLTPAPGQPETVTTRRLPRATIGDVMLIGGAGAYCASMAAHDYNSFPSAAEVMV